MAVLNAVDTEADMRGQTEILTMEQVCHCCGKQGHIKSYANIITRFATSVEQQGIYKQCVQPNKTQTAQRRH